MTGLVTVETGDHWSLFGEVVILVLIQAGGLGIMTLATCRWCWSSRRLGLRARLLAQAETKTISRPTCAGVVRNVILFSLLSEAVVAAVLTARFVAGLRHPSGRPLYHGVFHAVSAFNNAGFALYADSLIALRRRPLDHA